MSAAPLIQIAEFRGTHRTTVVFRAHPHPTHYFYLVGILGAAEKDLVRFRTKPLALAYAQDWANGDP
jgi:hypothetical protein